MPNSNNIYAMWLGGFEDIDAAALGAEYMKRLAQDIVGVNPVKWPSRPALPAGEMRKLAPDFIRSGIAAVDEDAPANRARETIKDLKAGTVPQSIVKDLGEAVKQATRDSGVGHAIGRDRMVGGMAR